MPCLNPTRHKLRNFHPNTPPKQTRTFRELTPLSFHPNTDRTSKQFNANRYKEYEENHMEKHHGKTYIKHGGYLVPTTQRDVDRLKQLNINGDPM